MAKSIGLIKLLLNAMSVSQALFFFIRLICVNDKNGLPLSVVSLLCKDPHPGSSVTSCGSSGSSCGSSGTV